MKKYDCVVIGRTCIDYIALVEKYPKVDTKTRLLKYEMCLGGQAANSSVVLSQLGLKTLLVTPIGDDFHGRLAKEFLSNVKNLDVLVSKKDVKTPCAFIWSDINSFERTIVYEKIEGNTLYPEKLLIGVLKTTKFLLFDHQSSEDLAKIVNKILNYRPKFMMDAERNEPYMWKLLPYINYFVFSKELVKSLKTTVKDLLRKTIKMGPEIVCCTLAEKGAIAMVRDSNKVYYSKAAKVKPIDTTGAGDVFHAGFMYGVINNWKIEDILSFANKLAGISTKFIGGSTFVYKCDLKGLTKLTIE